MTYCIVVVFIYPEEAFRVSVHTARRLACIVRVRAVCEQTNAVRCLGAIRRGWLIGRAAMDTAPLYTNLARHSLPSQARQPLAVSAGRSDAVNGERSPGGQCIHSGGRGLSLAVLFSTGRA